MAWAWHNRLRVRVKVRVGVRIVVRGRIRARVRARVRVPRYAFMARAWHISLRLLSAQH